MSGLSDKLSGQLKQAAGKATDDKKLQNEGKAEETKGAIKENVSNVVDKVSDTLGEAKKRLQK